MNKLKLNEKGLSIQYRQSCSTSWFELIVVERREYMKNEAAVEVEEIELILQSSDKLKGGFSGSSSGDENMKTGTGYFSGSTGTHDNQCPSDKDQ